MTTTKNNNQPIQIYQTDGALEIQVDQKQEYAKNA